MTVRTFILGIDIHSFRFQFEKIKGALGTVFFIQLILDVLIMMVVLCTERDNRFYNMGRRSESL